MAWKIFLGAQPHTPLFLFAPKSSVETRSLSFIKDRATESKNDSSSTNGRTSLNVQENQESSINNFMQPMLILKPPLLNRTKRLLRVIVRLLLFVAWQLNVFLVIS